MTKSGQHLKAPTSPTPSLILSPSGKSNRASFRATNWWLCRLRPTRLMRSCRALNEFIRNGGTVMTVGQCFTHDQYGRPRKDALVASGRGRLVNYPEPLTAHAYRDVLDRLLDQAGAARVVRIEGPHGEPVWGVNVRAVEANGRLLVNLLNLSREPRRVQLVTKPSARRALNLMDGKEIEFPFTLSPLEPTLLALKLR